MNASIAGGFRNITASQLATLVPRPRIVDVRIARAGWVQCRTGLLFGVASMAGAHAGGSLAHLLPAKAIPLPSRPRARPRE
jgi:uncharacterized membrane protein YfcA